MIVHPVWPDIAEFIEGTSDCCYRFVRCRRTKGRELAFRKKSRKEAHTLSRVPRFSSYVIYCETVYCLYRSLCHELQVIMNDEWSRMRQNIVMPILKYCSETGSENLLNTAKLCIRYVFRVSKSVDSIWWWCQISEGHTEDLPDWIFVMFVAELITWGRISRLVYGLDNRSSILWNDEVSCHCLYLQIHLLLLNNKSGNVRLA
jgi:hypothetical protein